MMHQKSPTGQPLVTKQTNYAGIAGIHSETAGVAKHVNKKAANVLGSTINKYEHQHRKEMNHLHNHRKSIETSMLAYTERMKELNLRRGSNFPVLHEDNVTVNSFKKRSPSLESVSIQQEVSHTNQTGQNHIHEKYNKAGNNLLSQETLEVANERRETMDKGAHTVGQNTNSIHEHRSKDLSINNDQSRKEKDTFKDDVDNILQEFSGRRSKIELENDRELVREIVEKTRDAPILYNTGDKVRNSPLSITPFPGIETNNNQDKIKAFPESLKRHKRKSFDSKRRKTLRSLGSPAISRTKQTVEPKPLHRKPPRPKRVITHQIFRYSEAVDQVLNNNADTNVDESVSIRKMSKLYTTDTFELPALKFNNDVTVSSESPDCEQGITYRGYESPASERVQLEGAQSAPSMTIEINSENDGAMRRRTSSVGGGTSKKSVRFSKKLPKIRTIPRRMETETSPSEDDAVDKQDDRSNYS